MPDEPKSPQNQTTSLKRPFPVRGLVLQAMVAANALTDETMPQEKMQIFADKPFREWPKEMQDQLRPFGAEMIQ